MAPSEVGAVRRRRREVVPRGPGPGPGLVLSIDRIRSIGAAWPEGLETAMRRETTWPRTPAVLDTTLREGEQFPGAHFTPEDRVRLALALDAFGVDELELPSPAISPLAAAELGELLRIPLRARAQVHTRCHPADVEAALAAGATGLHLFLGTSDQALTHSLQTSWEVLAGRIRDAVGDAHRAGAFVRFSAEDAFRTPRSRLFSAFDVAVEAGAERLGLPDTVGIATPEMVGATVRAIRRRYPGVSLEFHGHNDTGCAVANSLAAWMAGADCLDVTVLGIGERVGITSLSGLMARLLTLSPQLTARYRLERLPALDADVAGILGLPIPFNQPLTGGHAFTHVAGIHTNAVLREPGTYEAIDPSVVGRTRRLSATSRLAGRHAVAQFAQGVLGRRIDAREAQLAATAIKSAATRGALADAEAAAVVRAALAGCGEE